MPSSRRSRSDAGILALTRALLTDVLGLEGQTISKVMKVVRSSGQLQDLKQNLRGIDSLSYKRLNQVIDLIEKKKGEKKKKGGKKEEKGAKQEEVSESFLEFLLTELQLDTDELRNDPKAKQDMMRLARASDTQAKTMTDRMSREKVRSDRQEVQQEKDPKRSQLLRKKMTLKKQIAMIDNELAAGAAGNQQQAGTQGTEGTL